MDLVQVTLNNSKELLFILLSVTLSIVGAIMSPNELP